MFRLTLLYYVLRSCCTYKTIAHPGPASEIMSTSFTSAPPSEPTSPEDRSQAPPPAPAAADLLKEWDSDSDDSRSSNPSSGEFIWKVCLICGSDRWVVWLLSVFK